MSNAETWQKLELIPIRGETIAARLAFPSSSERLYAGIDSNKQRHFLIPIADSDDDYNDFQSRGLSVSTKNMVVYGSPMKKYLDVVCHDRFGYTIFDIIGDEIAIKLEKDKPKEAVAEVISKWRHFWGKVPQDILSYEQVTGLFADLWFLYNWLFPKKTNIDTVNCWRGPFSSRHDFEWVGKSVEVKVTTKVEGRTHKINGIDQLSPPENGKLFLFSLRLREEQGSENTLPQLIALCQERLKNNIEALSKFENTLAVAGYSPVHDDEYSKYRFRIVDEKLYEVKEGFPRIIVNSFGGKLPEGVLQVGYSISLEGFDRFCVATSPDKTDF